MSFKNEPIPAAAAAAGMTNLVFADDFDSLDTIDFSGEGKPECNWYATRPYGLPTLTKEEFSVKDSVLTITPNVCPAAIGLLTYSQKSGNGFAMHYGYAEARIRAKEPVGEYDGVPAFWGIDKIDLITSDWTDCGELDIVELFRQPDETGVERKYYTGTLHHHRHTGEMRENGEQAQVLATNLVNAGGYKGPLFMDDDWHTYAALWEPGHIAWYLDGRLMHAARYSADALPEYYYRDDPTPLPRIEDKKPELAQRTWVGAQHIMESAEEVLVLGCNKNWPMDVDWVRVWQK